ncbi:MAG TPA: DUF1292 domain-containing protein [Desulfotomaculum sp.]|nr:MAG: hypothetical protein VR67_12420 [Peptococcaceae bacterium BRH_c8a]KJS70781.1 MAG: hypothetical protein JL56_16285 [Desulfotomaculum sp. BICA1-6]HBX22317.1 DUF1292 domain-containing protein [Desulfotomaculum sp.]
MPELDDIITIVDEDGAEHDVAVYGVLDVEGKTYAVLAPADDEEEVDGESETESEAFILRFDMDEDGNEIMVEIDDEEWDKVKDKCMAEFDFFVEE